jgi:hypothetical protein
MPDLQTVADTPPAAEPTPQELTEILAELEFFLHMDAADTLPLDEEEVGDEPQ